MFSFKKISFLIFILLSSALYSTIINVPGTWATIQSAIDVSLDADTVLVQPGVYYENINYNGKLITIGSLFLTTQDSAYIASTIIDGSNSGSVVTFGNGENDTTLLCGFTITNGSNNYGGGIRCSQSSPNLRNLLVINNSVSEQGGGVSCYYSNPNIENVTISSNIASEDAGGILFDNSSPNLINVTISDNTSNTGGGGVRLYGSSNAIFNNVIISDNSTSFNGAGIKCDFSNPILTNVTFSGNTSSNPGGCIFVSGGANMSLVNCIMWNDLLEEISILSGTVTVTYSNIQDGYTGVGNIDTNPMFVNPNIGDYHLQANSPCIDAGDPASPLDPDGTTADMGAFYFYQPPVADFTADTTIGIPPFTVNFTDLSTQGIGPIDEWYWDFGDGNTSTLQNPSNEYQDYGGYTVSLTVTNISGFTDTITKENYITANATGYNGPVWHISTTGSDEYGNGSEELPFATIQHGFDVSADADTILVQPGTYVENIEINEKQTTIGSLFLTTGNAEYISSTIIDGDSDGNVVYFVNANPQTVLSGFTITNGSHGIYCINNSNITLKNLIITGNSATQAGGGIYCSFASPIIMDVTISDNSASELGGGIFFSHSDNPILENVTITDNYAADYGGGICCIHASNPSLINCIIWNNALEEISFYGDSDPNSITVSYSDIEGGEAGIETNDNGTVNWLDGNLDTDPLFVDAGNGDYNLSEDSPCIDAGDPTSPLDPDGTTADMGAWFYNQGSAIEENEIENVKFNLSNYPNPFNPLTTIKFDIKENEIGVLKIFNIKGQLLESHQFDAGQHNFQWDASSMSSGVYLYQLQTENNTVNKKMLLLK